MRKYIFFHCTFYTFIKILIFISFAHFTEIEKSVPLFTTSECQPKMKKGKGSILPNSVKTWGREVSQRTNTGNQDLRDTEPQICGELKPIVNKSYATDLEPLTWHFSPILAYVTKTTIQFWIFFLHFLLLFPLLQCLIKKNPYIYIYVYKIVIPSIVSSDSLQWDDVYDQRHITTENRVMVYITSAVCTGLDRNLRWELLGLKTVKGNLVPYNLFSPWVQWSPQTRIIGIRLSLPEKAH